MWSARYVLGQLAGRALPPVQVGPPPHHASVPCHSFPSPLLQPELDSLAAAWDMAGYPCVLAQDQ